MSKDNRIKEFWFWFDDNKSLYEMMQGNQDDKLNLIINELRKITDGLSVEITVNQPIKELTISAEGNIEKFPIVKEIVAKAPTIVGWKVIAFRQPVEKDFTLEYGDIRLTPSKLHYSPVTDGDSLDIIVFGEGFKDYNQNELAQYGLIMLDNLMGEYNCVAKVRYYDFQDVRDADGYELKPLPEINLFIESFYKAK
jgi:hypothetical protein